MEKLWILKDKIVSNKKLLEIEGVVYRAQEERGEQVHAKLEPSDYSPASAVPVERLLAVPELCFAYLKLLASNAKAHSPGIRLEDEDLEMREALTTVFLEGRKVRTNLAHCREKLKKSNAALNLCIKKQSVYTKEYEGMVPQAELEKNNAEIETWKTSVTEAAKELEVANVLMPTLFYNAIEVRAYFAKTFGYEVGHSTLLRYAAEGMPKPRNYKSGKHLSQRPTALSKTAERDLLKVLRFASDRGIPYFLNPIHIEWTNDQSES